MPARRGAARHDRGCSRPWPICLRIRTSSPCSPARATGAAARRAAGAGGCGCRLALPAGPLRGPRPRRRCGPALHLRQPDRAGLLRLHPGRSLIGLPSRLSAEAPEHAERQRLLDAVARDGFTGGYRGLRIAKGGRRFWIEPRGGLAARPRRRDDRSGGDLRGMARRVSDRTSSRGSATRHRRPARMARSRDPASRRSLPSRRPAGPSRPGSGLEALPIASRHGTRRRPGPGDPAFPRIVRCRAAAAKDPLQAASAPNGALADIRARHIRIRRGTSPGSSGAEHPASRRHPAPSRDGGHVMLRKTTAAARCLASLWAVTPVLAAPGGKSRRASATGCP